MSQRHFRIWRGDAEGGDFVDYHTEVDTGMVVLDVILILACIGKGNCVGEAGLLQQVDPLLPRDQSVGAQIPIRKSPPALGKPDGQVAEALWHSPFQ